MIRVWFIARSDVFFEDNRMAQVVLVVAHLLPATMVAVTVAVGHYGGRYERNE